MQLRVDVEEAAVPLMQTLKTLLTTNKGYATTTCVCFVVSPAPPSLRGQGITQGNYLNCTESCNGNNNKERAR